MRRGQTRRVVRFPKRERRALERAVKAIREIYKRGFDCLGECRVAERAITEMLEYDDREHDPEKFFDPYSDTYY